ncbi:MAG TPA: DMT family transporter [Acidimicrobiia bacterium]|jgi:drug/metabolite transporter (DMT)-like permease|nr:DMT family transporter [Acidimicrobiia bacterium]
MRIPPARWVAIGGTVCISFSGIFVALSGVSPVTSAFFRIAYAMPLLLAIGWYFRRDDPRSTRQRWGAFAAGVFLGIDLFFFHSAIDRIGAGLATVAVHTQVIFVGLLSWLLYRHVPTQRTLTFGGVIFLGVALLSGLGRSDAFGDDPVTGVLMGLAAGVTYAAFLITIQAANPRGAGPAARVLADASWGTLAVTGAIGLLTNTLEIAPSWPAHGWLIALALLIQIAGWASITYALPRLPALTVSVIILGQPMLAVVWGWIFLDERLSSTQAVGVALVVVGLAAVNTQREMVRAG